MSRNIQYGDRPKLDLVTLADLDGMTGFLWQEKADGVHAFLELGGYGTGGPFQAVVSSRQKAPDLAGTVLNCERMPDGVCIVNDLVSLDGTDCRRMGTLARWQAILDNWRELARRAASQGVRLELARVGRPADEFFRAILAEGGEGIVGKPLDGWFGQAWVKCKRFESFDFRVVDLDGARLSVRLASPDGTDRGWCRVGESFQDVEIGDVVEVGGAGLTVHGKVREPRFMRTRPDKDFSQNS